MSGARGFESRELDVSSYLLYDKRHESCSLLATVAAICG